MKTKILIFSNISNAIFNIKLRKNSIKMQLCPFIIYLNICHSDIDKKTILKISYFLAYFSFEKIFYKLFLLSAIITLHSQS